MSLGDSGIADSSTRSVVPAPSAASPSSFDLPRQRQPERRVGVLGDRLDLHVGDAGALELLGRPRRGLHARREAGDAAPDLAGADLLARLALLRDRDRAASRSLRIAAPWNSGDAASPGGSVTGRGPRVPATTAGIDPGFGGSGKPNHAGLPDVGSTRRGGPSSCARAGAARPARSAGRRWPVPTGDEAARVA